MSKINEFSRGWRILILAFFGVATSAAVLPLYGFGALVVPLQDAFGWQRSDIMATTSFSTFGSIFSAQLAGWLNRSYGIRPVAMLSFVGLFGVFILLSQIDKFGHSIWWLYAFFMLITFAGVGTLQVTWTQLVNLWFEKNRGFALAIILSGSGFIGVVLPYLITSVIDIWSWRAGFILLAVLPLVITMPLAYFWLVASPYSKPDKQAIPADSTAESVEIISMPGFSFAEGIRSWRYWVINFSMVMVAAAIMVILINAVPMIIDKGYSAIEASQLFSVFGVSLVVGRLTVGYLVDRLWAPGVACVVILLSALGCYLLGSEVSSSLLLIISISLVGVGAGAEFDIAAFLIARYFGMRDYARLFGLQMGVIGAGICLAPTAVAVLYEQTGTYDIVLSVNVALLVIGSFILVTLGKYPVFDSSAQKT